jgi:signal transduction histidine kinase/CheY-like chemotaxis protein
MLILLCLSLRVDLSSYNFDALSHSSVNESYNELFGALPRAIISRASTFNETDYLPSPDNGDDDINATYAEDIKNFIANYVHSVLDLHVIPEGEIVEMSDDPEEEALDPIREPFIVINYPILNYGNYSSFFYDNGDKENIGGVSSSPVIGLLTVLFCWRDFIRDILPHSESNGIMVVFENQCNQTFTYEVDGPNAVFLGEGDLHDPQYSHMAKGTNVSDLAPYSPMGRFYTGVPLGDGLCPYTMTVYPSAETESAYSTSNPLVFTVCAVLIFLFTSAVFLIYDVCVEKRQQKVMDTAIQSSENVSLLEQMVRERTHKLEETNTRLAEANRRVLRASAAQLEHFACMSHEIRTPLNCIVGLSSLLLDTELNGMQEESMRMIVTSGDLLLTVVNDVLDYSKLESGNVEIRIVRSNLQDTLSAVVQSIEARARIKCLSIRTTYDPRIGEYCMMDCRRLQQILYNILGNAVKFSNPDGTIDLTISLIKNDILKDDVVNGHTYKSNREDEVIRTNSVIVYEDPLKGRRSSFKLVHRGSFANKSASSSDPLSGITDTLISFVIKDCGKGIEKKDFKKIFEPFRQASAETERVYGGTGLGLAVTAKLVTGLGGTISVDSCEGEWSEFTVNLPYRDAPFDIEKLALRLTDTSILFVEDDERTRRDVFSMFQKCHLNYFSYNSMNEMVFAISESNYLRSNRVYICLVNEALYDEKSYHVLAEKAPFVLLTFGPKFSIKASKCHYRSLTQVFPSVLVESFVDAIQNVPRPGYDRSANDTEQKKTSAFHRSSGKFAIENPVDIRILIAEDNVINQKVLLRILTRLGYENVDVVDNGQKACDQEEKHYYDIILMDVQMPVMSGIDACQIIMNRTTTNHPKPKIVFVTAHVSDAFETECRNAGGTDFLPKPFNLNDIENCLHRNTSQ